jgi:hypothetical protein
LLVAAAGQLLDRAAGGLALGAGEEVAGMGALQFPAKPGNGPPPGCRVGVAQVSGLGGDCLRLSLRQTADRGADGTRGSRQASSIPSSDWLMSITPAASLMDLQPGLHKYDRGCRIIRVRSRDIRWHGGPGVAG